MPKKQVIQVGGSKEAAPLAIGGNGDVGHQSPQERIFTPEDAEFQRYSDLLKGFLGIAARWQEIFRQEQYRTRDKGNDPQGGESYRSGFEVLQTPQGLIIAHVVGDPHNSRKAPANRVLYAESDNLLVPPDEDGNYGGKEVHMLFRAGQAGKQLFVDPEGEPLDRVGIGVCSFWSGNWLRMTIDALGGDLRDIKYQLKEGALEVSRYYSPYANSALMPEAYQAHIFNTIDALIPGSRLPTVQTGDSTRPETQTPKQLPLAWRRTQRR
jgi:hypothetical protein